MSDDRIRDMTLGEAAFRLRAAIFALLGAVAQAVRWREAARLAERAEIHALGHAEEWRQRGEAYNGPRTPDPREETP